MVAVEAAIAGGLLGNLVWACLDVRHRVSRAGAILVGLCLAAWAIFLSFGAPHEWPQPQQRRDGSIDLIHDAPVAVAGRSVGTFGSVNAADRILNVVGGPAVVYASALTMVASSGADESVGLSYVVAGFAFALSTGFWLAAGNALAARLERRRGLSVALRTPG